MSHDARVRTARAVYSCSVRKAIRHGEDTKQTARTCRNGKHELARARRLEDQEVIQQEVKEEELAGHDMDRCVKHHIPIKMCPDCYPLPEDAEER
jgi:hypothetical protein